MMKTVLSALMGLAMSTMAWAVPTENAVLEHYADLAHAMYGDSLETARTLQRAVDTLIAEPTEGNLRAARNAWLAARRPYQQSEAYRFGNPIVDEWEGKVNAWPLDEGLIDYVAPSYGTESEENPLYTANVIANPRLVLSGQTIDAGHITKALLAGTLHEAGEVEANVATGYHAIEFLLWGQDLNGTGPGAGTRPASDFDPAHCTGGNCGRRVAYLKAATGLLLDDLEWMVAQWTPEGAAREALTRGDVKQGLSAIFTGMGSLSYGELAGDRMKLGLMLHDPEEEHDCFSDSTPWSYYYDVLGIQEVYTGNYTRVDGSKLAGPSLSDLLAARDPAMDRDLRNRLDATLARMRVLVESADNGMAYDQLIGANNPEGNAKVSAAIDALVAQTKTIEKSAKIMGLDSIASGGSNGPDTAGR